MKLQPITESRTPPLVFLFGLFGIAILLAPLHGCAGSGDGPAITSNPGPAELGGTSRADQGRELFAPLGGVGTTAGGSLGAGDQGSTSDAWSIAIANFPNSDSGQAAAEAALGRVRTHGKLPAAFLEARSKRIVLAYGRYDGPGDPQAQRDLDRVHALQIDGQQPYAGAILSPPAPDRVFGSIPEFDLRNARRIHGPEALYTLQIGVYGRPDASETPPPGELKEYREAAERAVIELRRDGDEAFYYHGPTRSTVTVGVFTQRDHDPTYRVRPNDPPRLRESARLIDTKQRFPNNLLNGRGIRERLPGRSGTRDSDFRLQPSTLVRIPD